MKKRLPVFLLAIILIVALTLVINAAVNNYKYTNRDRVIFLAYQTNITGSDAENWQKELTNQFAFEVEVSVYTTNKAGNEQITITTENGWQQVVTRLGAKQGDILLLNKETFQAMLDKDFLSPISFIGENAVLGDDNLTYGIDISGKTANGLIAFDTSKYVAQYQPLPICSLDDSVIAVIYKGSAHKELSEQIILSLWGE